MQMAFYDAVSGSFPATLEDCRRMLIKEGRCILSKVYCNKKEEISHISCACYV